VVWLHAEEPDPLHDEPFVEVLVSTHRLSVDEILAYVSEGQAAAGRGSRQKFERRDEAGLGQVLRDPFSDKKRLLGCRNVLTLVEAPIASD
jgi:hypothetical protein